MWGERIFMGKKLSMAINRDAGVIRRVAWLNEQVAPADATGLLSAVRTELGVEHV